MSALSFVIGCLIADLGKLAAASKCHRERVAYLPPSPRTPSVVGLLSLTFEWRWWWHNQRPQPGFHRTIHGLRCLSISCSLYITCVFFLLHHISVCTLVWCIIAHLKTPHGYYVSKKGCKKGHAALIKCALCSGQCERVSPVANPIS